MAVKTIEVIFKRSIRDTIRNLFVPKAKRFPRVATFTGFTYHTIEKDGGLEVQFGSSVYIYPAHMIGRIKVSTK